MPELTRVAQLASHARLNLHHGFWRGLAARLDPRDGDRAWNIAAQIARAHGLPWTGGAPEHDAVHQILFNGTSTREGGGTKGLEAAGRLRGMNTTDQRVDRIQRTIAEVCTILRNPENTDLIPYALESCAVLIDLVQDRAPAGWATIQQASIARELLSIGHLSAADIGDEVAQLDDHIQDNPADVLAHDERARIAEVLHSRS